MPQARKELREQFPGGMEDATRLLKQNGYICTPLWRWKLPPGQSVPRDKEMAAIQYLIDEWDFGGLEIKDN